MKSHDFLQRLIYSDLSVGLQNRPLTRQASLTLEIEGKFYIAAIPKDKMDIILSLAGALFDDGKLPLIPAPEGFHFEKVKQ